MTWSELMSFLNVSSSRPMPILLVLGKQDEETTRLKAYLTARGYLVHVAARLDALISSPLEMQADALFLKDAPPGMDLHNLMLRVQKSSPHLPILISRTLACRIGSAAQMTNVTIGSFDTPSDLLAAIESLRQATARASRAAAD